MTAPPPGGWLYTPPPYVSRWDKLKKMMVSVILGVSYNADVCSSVNISDTLDFNLFFDAIKRGFHIMTDS